MKKTLKISAMFLVMVMAVFVAACGGDVNPEVKNFVGNLDKMNSIMSKGEAINENDAIELLTLMKDLTKYNDSEVVLNDADRDALKKSVTAILKTSTQLTGDDLPDSLLDEVNDEIGSMKTLGQVSTELNNGIMMGFNED